MNRFRKAYRGLRLAAAHLADAGEDLMFGDYHAARNDGRRSQPKSSTGSEDAAGSDTEKQRVVATTRSQRRNIEIAQWIVNTHLSAQAKFTFQAHTGNKDLDKFLEREVKRLSKPENFDMARRRSRQQMLYVMEGGRFVDGDIFPTFTNTGRVQVIEKDRIRTPYGRGTTRYPSIVDGVAKNATTGEHLAYAVHQRVGSAFRFQQWNPVRFSRQLAYTKRHDQDRGVSPLVTCINRLQDLYEGMEAMAIKTKFHAMFGIAFEGADMDEDDEFEVNDASTGEAATSASEKSDLEFDITPGLRLKSNGKVNTIESKTPHPAYMDWSELNVHIAMLAADVPYSWFDSRKSSYNARYADTQRYYAMRDMKQAPLVEFQDDWLIWQMVLGEAARRFDLAGFPMKTGTVLTVDDFRDFTDELFEWVPGGIPFLDPKQEIEAALMAIAAGLDSQPAWCKRHGRDSDSLLDQLETYQKDVKQREVTLYIGKPGQEELFPPEEDADDFDGDAEDDNDNEDDEDNDDE